MNIRSTLITLCAALVAASGCRTPSERNKSSPKFEDYPVTEVFEGNAAPLQPITAEEKAISQDATTAIERRRAPDGSKLNLPNFAGHYLIIVGPNAPDYMQAVVVDLSTGRVFQPPFAGEGGSSASYFSIPMDPVDFEGVKFRLDSKLLVLPRSSSDRNRGYAAYYFIWDNNKWIQVH